MPCINRTLPGWECSLDSRLSERAGAHYNVEKSTNQLKNSFTTSEFPAGQVAENRPRFPPRSNRNHEIRIPGEEISIRSKLKVTSTSRLHSLNLESNINIVEFRKGNTAEVRATQRGSIVRLLTASDVHYFDPSESPEGRQVE